MIVVIALALTGLVITQVYWIKDAVHLKSEEFDQSVKEALYQTIDDYHSLKKSKHKLKKPKHEKQYAHPEQSIDVRDSLVITLEDTLPLRIVECKIINGNNKIIYSHKQVIGVMVSLDSLRDSLIQRNERIIHDETKMKSKNNVVWNENNNELNIIQDHRADLPLTQRINVKAFDSLFKKNLELRGITQSYMMMVGYENEKPALFSDDESKKNADFIAEHTNTHTATLSEADYYHKSVKISVLFPQRVSFLVGQLGWLLVASGGLILILIVSFYYSIKTIFVQKKLSDVKNDFINNMTHELKTPISTIGLATEMLNDDSISTTDKQRKNYVTMIRDENKRLGKLVESVLQSAVIEKGELKLEPEKLELNELIREIATNFEIQVNQRNGKLNLKLNAARDFVNGDKVHLSNVIFNLLDNANKYSFETPDIGISTGNAGEKIIISVSDHGIGIKKENQKKIFEKLYRIPTGNVHNVKGFGLGLSYVKAVVEKHEGEISIDSEPGKGSTFTISLPLYHGKEN